MLNYTRIVLSQETCWGEGPSMTFPTPLSQLVGSHSRVRRHQETQE